MSGQFSASLSLDELPEGISTKPTPDPGKAISPADRLGNSEAGTDRPALEAKLTAPAWRRWGELRLRVGILLHLVCNAFIGVVIIVVFFGIAFSMLGHTTKETVANSGARDRHVASVGAETEIPRSAPSLSAVPSRSGLVQGGELPSKVAPAADPPAAVATAPETPAAMTALAASEPGSIQLPTTGSQPSQGLGSIAIAETPGRLPS